jgi:broad specificity phosphatase PhoE
VAEVAERTQAAMRNIAHLYPTGSILIVSHGLALATIICQDEGIPLDEAFGYIPENAVPTWVEWKKSR